MNHLFFSIFAFLAVFSLSQATFNARRGERALNSLSNETLSLIGGLTRAQILQRRIITNGGCNVNICFALDGSGSMSTEDYKRQSDFAVLVSAILAGETEAEFAAVQYGLRNVGISGLTNNANRFLFRVARSRSARAPRTFIAAGLGFCIRELRRRPEDANKIVVIGDGRSNFGGSPVDIAQQFLPPQGTGSICTIGIGFPDIPSLVAIAGDADRLLPIDDYNQLLDALELLVADICGLPSFSDGPIVRKFEENNVSKKVKSSFKA